MHRRSRKRRLPRPAKVFQLKASDKYVIYGMCHVHGY
jgi:hypothetical protein